MRTEKCPILYALAISALLLLLPARCAAHQRAPLNLCRQTRQPCRRLMIPMGLDVASPHRAQDQIRGADGAESIYSSLSSFPFECSAFDGFRNGRLVRSQHRADPRAVIGRRICPSFEFFERDAVPPFGGTRSAEVEIVKYMLQFHAFTRPVHHRRVT